MQQILYNTSLNPTQRLILMYLIDNKDKRVTCRDIANKLGVSENTVTPNLRVLEFNEFVSCGGKTSAKRIKLLKES